jgi:hypothetical protein
MQEIWTAAQYREYVKTGKKPNSNKYGAKRAEWNGRSFDSTGEMEYAQQLDILKKAGEIKRVTYQHKLRLEHDGEFICDYLIDFRIVMADGTIELHEFKGMETDVWKQKWKLTKAQLPELEPNATLKLIKKAGLRFETVEVFRCEKNN